MDGPTGTFLKDFPGIAGSLMVYDKSGKQLITAALGGSSLSRYAFDSSLLTLTKTQSLSNAGSNGQDLAISPDGNHIAFPCGGGNGAGYTIFDFSSDNLNAIYGEWDTNAYPSAAAFDPTGRYLVATNGDSIQVFDVLTHAKIKEYFVSMTNCDYSDLQKVGFSRGGKIVYAFSNCGFNDDHGKLFWAVFEP